MGHADYDCCAVCDSKLSYSSDATTKAVVCGECAVALARYLPEFSGSVESLMKEIREHASDAEVALRASGFALCWYGNPVDSLVREVLPEFYAELHQRKFGTPPAPPKPVHA